jgi:adenylate cyclase
VDRPAAAESRLEKLVRRLDHPMLVLAAVSVLIYLLDMRGWLENPRIHESLRLLESLIDVLFVADLGLKLAAMGRSYARTPWFLIDAISALPILATLSPAFTPLRGIRFVRGLRVERALRTLRALQMLESIPAFRHFAEGQHDATTAKRFERATTFGVIAYSTLLMALIFSVRRAATLEFQVRMEDRLRTPVTSAELAALGGSLTDEGNGANVELLAVVDGKPRTALFKRSLAERQANLFEFYLVGGTLIGMFLIIYVGFYHLQDISSGHLRSFLYAALPRQVAAQAFKEPKSYHDKSRMPATIVFMDIRGFTASCEKLGDDLDTLSKNLESVMDVVVQQLNKHDLIVDKFIGDAIMSFRGGPLVAGGDAENAYRVVRASLDAAQALRELGNPYFKSMKVGGASAHDCLIGAFGTSTRLSYTILGDGVNLAARLEPASGQCGTQNLFCETTRSLCEGRSDLLWRRWGQIRVPGKANMLKVFEALDSKALDGGEFVETYHRALELFERKEFQKARALFLKSGAQRAGGDAPSKEYVTWCETLLREGIPADWEPAARTKK